MPEPTNEELYRRLLKRIHRVASANDMGNKEAWEAISKIVKMTEGYK